MRDGKSIKISPWQYLWWIAFATTTSANFAADIASDLPGYRKDWPSLASPVERCPDLAGFYELRGEISYIVDPKPPMVGGGGFIDIYETFIRRGKPPSSVDRMSFEFDRSGGLLVNFLYKEKILSTESLVHNGDCNDGWFVALINIDTNSEGATRWTEHNVELRKAADGSLMVRTKTVHKTSALIIFKTEYVWAKWVRFRPVKAS